MLFKSTCLAREWVPLSPAIVVGTELGVGVVCHGHHALSPSKKQQGCSTTSLNRGTKVSPPRSTRNTGTPGSLGFEHKLGVPQFHLVPILTTQSQCRPIC